MTINASHRHPSGVRSSTIRDGAACNVVVDGLDIALIKWKSTVYAVKNLCPHQLFRKLHEGSISDGAVTCPLHGWTFDLATGASRTGQGRLVTYPVAVVNDEIHVDLPV